MIQVENLTKYYRDLCAVDQINLNIQKGEILGLNDTPIKDAPSTF